jgi:hypothetical protein
MNDIMLILKQLNGIVLRQEQQLFSSMVVEVPMRRSDEWKYKINNLRNVHFVDLL